MKKVFDNSQKNNANETGEVSGGLFGEFDALEQGQGPLEYLVIGNFSWSYNDSLAQRETVKLDMADESFLAIFKDFAVRNGLKVEFAINDTIVLQGDEETFNRIIEENGDSFSYTKCGSKHYEAVMEASGEYFLESEQDTADRIPENAVFMTTELN